MFSKKISYLVIIFLLILIFISKQKIVPILLLIAYISFILLPAILFILGNKKYNENSHAAALKLLKKSSSLVQATTKTKISCAYMLIKLGDLETSKRILNSLDSRKLTVNQYITFNLISSILLWKENNLAEAINLMKSLHSKYKTTGIYQNLGFYLLLNGDYDKALEFNIEAYDYNNTDHTILDNLGMNYYFLEQYDKALDIYEKFINLNPSFPSAYFYYALTQIKLGNKEIALSSLEKGLKCNFSNLAGVTKADFEENIKNLNQIS